MLRLARTDAIILVMMAMFLLIRTNLKRKALRLVPGVASVLIRWWSNSCSVITVINGEFEVEQVASGQGCVYVTWHQRLFNLYFLNNQ